MEEEKAAPRERAQTDSATKKKRKPPASSISPETRKKRFDSFFQTIDTEFKGLSPEDFAKKLDIIYQRQGSIKQRLDEIDSYTRKDNQYVRDQQETETQNRSAVVKELGDSLREQFESALHKMSLELKEDFKLQQDKDRKELRDRLFALIDKVNDTESNFITKDELMKLSEELKSATREREDAKKIQETLIAQYEELRTTQTAMTDKMAVSKSNFITKDELLKLSEGLKSATREREEAKKIQETLIAQYEELRTTQTAMTDKIAVSLTKEDFTILSEDFNSQCVDLNDVKKQIHGLIDKNSESLEHQKALRAKTETIELQHHDIAVKIQDLACKDDIKDINHKLKTFDAKLVEFLENLWKDVTENFVGEKEYRPKIKSITEELSKIGAQQQYLVENTLKLIEKDILAINLSKSDHYNEIMNKFAELSGEQKSLESKTKILKADLELLLKKNSESQFRGITPQQDKESINIEDVNQISTILKYIEEHEEKIRQSLKAMEELREAQKINIHNSESTQTLTKQVNHILETLKNMQSGEIRELFGRQSHLEEQILLNQQSQNNHAIIESFQLKVNELNNNVRRLHEKAMSDIIDISSRVDKYEKVVSTENQLRSRESDSSPSILEKKIGLLEEEIRDLATSQIQEEKKIVSLMEAIQTLKSELGEHIQAFSFYKSSNNGYLAKEDQNARETRLFLNTRIEKCLTEMKDLKIWLDSQQSEMQSFREQNEGIKTEMMDLRNNANKYGTTLNNLTFELRNEIQDQNTKLSQKIQENLDNLTLLKGRLSNKITLEATKTEERIGRIEEHISKHAQRSSLHLSRSFEEEENKQQSSRPFYEQPLSSENIIPPRISASNVMLPSSLNFQHSREHLDLIREPVTQSQPSFQPNPLSMPQSVLTLTASPQELLIQRQQQQQHTFNISQGSQMTFPFTSLTHSQPHQPIDTPYQSQQPKTGPKLNIVAEQFSSKRPRRI